MNRDNLPLPATESPSLASAQLRKSWKIWFGALACTLIANILCLPYWTDYDVMGFIRTPFNEEARIHVGYTGILTGAKAFSITSSEPSLDNPINYSYWSGSQLCIADMPIEEEWRTLSLTLNVRSKGSILISLKGPYRCNDYGETYSIAVDYKNLWIGGKEIFSDRKKVTHVKDFSYRIPVNAGDAIKISFDVRRHHLNAEDFHLIKTKNFWYIITLSILVFVISYILVRRILTVSCRCRKREDAVFLFIFFLLLAIPVSMISDAQISAREGRPLKQRPKVSSILKEGTNFGKEYDNWFCDHLGGRGWLIKLYDVIQRETQRTLRGRVAWYMQDNGWIFEDLGCHLGSKDIHPIVNAMVELEKFCEVNHIKLYVLVVPRMGSIYQEQLHESGFKKTQFVAENAIHTEIKRLCAKRRVTYIFPWTELRDARKQDYTFFKLTRHWTDWGAYVGYRTLMKDIRRDFPTMPVVSLGDYNKTQSNLIRDEWRRNYCPGNLRRFFNFETDSRCPSPPYNYYEHKNADKLVLNIGKFTKDFRYGGGAYKIMVIGSSQNENLMNFLPYSAAHTKYIRLGMGQLPGSETWKIMKHYKKDILSYKPNILIFSISAIDSNMLSIKDIFKQ